MFIFWNSCYDKTFPIRATIGRWKIENDNLYCKAERIISVKVPLQLKPGKIAGVGIIAKDQFIETTIDKDWKLLLSSVSTAYDKKLRYLYRPFEELLSLTDFKTKFTYYPETMRASSFATEEMFNRYPIRAEYIQLHKYLDGTLKVWDYIGTEMSPE